MPDLPSGTVTFLLGCHRNGKAVRVRLYYATHIYAAVLTGT